MWPGEDPSVGSLSEYVIEVCDGISLPFSELARLIRRNPLHLRRELSDLNMAKASTLGEVAECLDATTEDLLNRTISIQELALRRGGRDGIPEKYRPGAASKVGNVLPIMSYLDACWGPRVSRNILRELNLSVRLFETPQEPVSLLLICDVMDRLKPRGFRLDDFFEMGLQTPKIEHYQKMARPLSKFRSVRRMYEICMTEVVGTYEKNFFYSVLKSKPDSMIVQLRPNPAVQDAFDSHWIDTPEVASYRAGIIASQPGFMGKRSAKISSRRCMHADGSRAYEYELSW